MGKKKTGPPSSSYGHKTPWSTHQQLRTQNSLVHPALAMDTKHILVHPALAIDTRHILVYPALAIDTRHTLLRTRNRLFHPALTTDMKHTLVHSNLVTDMKSPVHTNGESVQTSAVRKPSLALTFMKIGTMFQQPVVHKTELVQPPADVLPTINTLSAALVLPVARIR